MMEAEEDPEQRANNARALETLNVRTFVELGPDGVLSAMAQDCVTGDGHAFVPALRKGRDLWSGLTVLRSLHGDHLRDVRDLSRVDSSRFTFELVSRANGRIDTRLASL